MLVDPPLADTYFISGHKDSRAHRVQLNLRPFLGHYENFAELPKFSEDWKSIDHHTRGGMLDDVISYWKQSVPACFDPENPTIQALAYYPFQIVAAEWVKYTEVMRTCIKPFEYPVGERPDLSRFNTDLRELQSWRRRSIRSQEKIQMIIRKLKSHESPDPHHRSAIEILIADFEVISNNIRIAGRRLENMLPVVTSLVQIIDARQSFAETANISRLTILALIFVPLSYVSSLFSMNEVNKPGGSGFWVYFAVAIPVTLVVFTVARPPTRILHRICEWLKSGRNPQPIFQRLRNTTKEERDDFRA